MGSSPITRTTLDSANGLNKPLADFHFMVKAILSVVCPLSGQTADFLFVFVLPKSRALVIASQDRTLASSNIWL